MKENRRSDLLPGTLEMLILGILAHGRLHGYGIAEQIRRRSEDVLTVGEGSLYPALQRLLVRGWVESEWAISETNRKARFYRLTKRGKSQVVDETQAFERLAQAVLKVMRPAQGSS